MVTFFRNTQKDHKLHQISEFKPGTWIYVENPTLEEVEKISEDFSLDKGHVKDALDPHEVSRLEFEGDTAYIFTRVPFEENGSFSTTPLLFIIGDTFLATFSQKHLDFFDKFLEGKIHFLTTQKIRLFIQLFSEVNNYFNHCLTSINRMVNNTTANVEKINNKDILQFVVYERILNNFLNTLTRSNTILNNLLSGKNLVLYKEDRELVEDLLLANDQLLDFCKSSLLLTGNIRNAYSTILANNLNRVMKLLTSLTIILTIPTIIASLFGMNVKLPFMSLPHAFAIILGISFLVSLSLMTLFYKKDWL